MQFSFTPINKLSLILYVAGLVMVFTGWLDPFSELNLFSEKLRLQLFIIGVIAIAVAAIINLSLYIINLYRRE